MGLNAGDGADGGVQGDVCPGPLGGAREGCPKDGCLKDCKKDGGSKGGGAKEACSTDGCT